MSSVMPAPSSKVPPSHIKADFVPTTEQQAALDQIRNFLAGKTNQDMIALSGAAGSGKTSTLQVLVGEFPTEKTKWTAMTGKAANRLSELAGVNATTLHSVLYLPPQLNWDSMKFINIKPPPEGCKVLVVDEASMMTPSVYNDLLTWVGLGVKIILVGDPYQLPPILDKKEEQAHGKDFSVFGLVKGPFLSKVMRSTNKIVEVAASLREKGFISRSGNEDYAFVVNEDPTQYAVDRYLEDPNDHMIITWRNEVRMEANRRIRERLGRKNTIAKGEPIIFRRTYQDFLNGDIGIVEHAKQGPEIAGIKTLEITLSDGQTALTTVQGGKQPMDGLAPYIPDKGKWRKYRDALKKEKIEEPVPITYGYVLTAHLAQGGQANRVTVFLTKDELQSYPFLTKTAMPMGKTINFGPRFVYTAISRARIKATFVTNF